MKGLGPVLLLGFILLTTMSSVPRAWAGDDLADQLNADYQGKVLTLRHFYAGKHLVFQADGSLAASAQVGPWTVDGEIFIDTIEAKGRTLKIRGRRVCLVFDTRKAPPRDVLEWLKESQANDRDKDDRNLREGAFWAKVVDLEIQVASGNPDIQEARAAMNAVFLAPGESMGDIVPDFWRGYFDHEGSPQKTGYSGVIYTIKRGEVSAPHQTAAPEPSYSEDARVAKYQGTMTLSVVVDPSGAVSDVVIITPLGLGLDENAVAAVRGWKFEPAMKDGEPVAVKIAIEVNFSLY